VCFAERDVATLERHRASEPGRRRHRFALHVELQPWFKAWWEAVDATAPGHVLWRHPDSLDELRRLPSRPQRTGPDVLDAVLTALA
jgi:hypothetical protein